METHPLTCPPPHLVETQCLFCSPTDPRRKSQKSPLCAFARDPSILNCLPVHLQTSHSFCFHIKGAHHDRQRTTPSSSTMPISTTIPHKLTTFLLWKMQRKMIHHSLNTHQISLLDNSPVLVTNTKKIQDPKGPCPVLHL